MDASATATAIILSSPPSCTNVEGGDGDEVFGRRQVMTTRNQLLK